MTQQPLLYVMQCNLLTPTPTGSTVWTWGPLISIDGTGAQSGQVGNIVVGSVHVAYTIPASDTSEYVYGDLSGTLPDPTVVGIQDIPVVLTNPQNYQVLTLLNDEWQNVNPQSTSSTQTIPTYANSLTTQQPLTARQMIFCDGYSSQNDGGQGYFNWNSTSTLTSNGGTVVAVNGIATGRWERVYEGGQLWVTWFGAKGDGTTDDAAAINATIVAAGYGGTVFFPRLTQNQSATQIYLIKSPLIMDFDFGTFNTTFLGDGPGADLTNNGLQVTILADFPVYSGVTGSLTSIDTSQGNFLGLGVVTMSLPQGFGSSVKPGDWVTISNATSTDANGFTIANGTFTILSVNPVDSSITFFGVNPLVGAANYYGVIVPDANNGNIHWSIKKPMIGLYTRGCEFRNLNFNGNNTVSSVFNYTQPTTNAATNNHFYNCCIQNCVIGVSAGGFGPTGSSSTQGNTFPVNNNCDNLLFDKCYFQNCSWTAYLTPSFSGQQKNAVFRYTDFTGTLNTSTQQFAICMFRGSFATYDCGFEQIGTSCVLYILGTDICTMRNSNIELTPRLLVVRNGVQGPAVNNAYIFLIDGVRWDTVPNSNTAGAYPTDGYIVQFNQVGGLHIRGLGFSGGIAGFSPPPVIALAGFTHAGGSDLNQSSQIIAIIEDCVFPTDLGEPQVLKQSICYNPQLSYAQSWISRNNSIVSTSTAISYGIADGTHVELPVPSYYLNGIPPYQLINVCHPVRQLAVNNSTNYDIYQHYFSTDIEIVGGGTSCVLNGMVAGKSDMLMTMTNLTGNPFQIANEDTGETTAVNRFHTLTGQNVVVTSSVDLRYSSTLNRWVVVNVAGTGSAGPANVINYGADPTGTNYSDAAFTKAMTIASAQSAVGSASIYIPTGYYRLANPWIITCACRIFGDAQTFTSNGRMGAYAGTDAQGSVLFFDSNTDGIISQAPNATNVYLENIIGIGSAFHNSFTTANFNMPNIGSTVVVPYNSVPSGLTTNQYVYVQDCGQMQVTNISGLNITLKNTGYVEPTNYNLAGCGLLNRPPGTLVVQGGGWMPVATNANQFSYPNSPTHGLQSGWIFASANTYNGVIHTKNVTLLNWAVGANFHQMEDGDHYDLRISGTIYGLINNGNQNTYYETQVQTSSIGISTNACVTTFFQNGLLQGNSLAHLSVGLGAQHGSLKGFHCESEWTAGGSAHGQCQNIIFDCRAGGITSEFLIEDTHFGSGDLQNIGLKGEAYFNGSVFPGTYGAVNGSPTIATSVDMRSYLTVGGEIIINGNYAVVSSVSSTAITLTGAYGGSTNSNSTMAFGNNTTFVTFRDIYGVGIDGSVTYSNQFNFMTFDNVSVGGVPPVMAVGTNMSFSGQSVRVTGQTQTSVSRFNLNNYSQFNGIRQYSGYNLPGYDLPSAQAYSTTFSAGCKILNCAVGGNIVPGYTNYADGYLGVPSATARNTAGYYYGTWVVGQSIILPAVYNGTAFVLHSVSGPGTTGATEPSWNTAGGSFTTDGYCVWTPYGPASYFMPDGLPVSVMPTSGQILQYNGTTETLVGVPIIQSQIAANTDGYNINLQLGVQGFQSTNTVISCVQSYNLSPAPTGTGQCVFPVWLLYSGMSGNITLTVPAMTNGISNIVFITTTNLTLNGHTITITDGASSAIISATNVKPVMTLVGTGLGDGGLVIA